MPSMSYEAAAALSERLERRLVESVGGDDSGDPGDSPGPSGSSVSRRTVLGGLALAGGAGAAGIGAGGSDGNDDRYGGGDHADGPEHGFFGTNGEYNRDRFDPHEFLREFNTGEPEGTDDVVNAGVYEENGRTVREFDITAVDVELEILPGVTFPMWTYNGQVPGPTLRVEEGDLIRINFTNGATKHAHTIHPHVRNLNPRMDGIPTNGPGVLDPGESFTYEWQAEPVGTHLYHCHTMPLKAHIHRGLYGTLIVDPKPEPVREHPRRYLDYHGPITEEVRNRAVRMAKDRNMVTYPDYVAPERREKGLSGIDEMVMVMNGFDTNFDGDNEVYAVNTRGFCYSVGWTDGRGEWKPGETKIPITVDRNELVRVHLVQTLEFDFVNSFHTHSQFFDYYDAGTTLFPNRKTIDTVLMCQAQRGVLEMDYSEHDPGLYMFHAHQSEFAELGWMSFFEVV